MMIAPFSSQKCTQMRARFPQLESTIHLAACSHAPLCLDVLAALKRYEQSLLREGVAWETWMEEVELTRAAFAGLIGAQAQDIALFSSVSDALSAVSSCLPWFGRDHVVSASENFPTMSQIWLAGQAQWRNSVTFVESPAGCSTAEVVEPQMTAHTALLCVSLANYTTGMLQPLAELVELAHQYGALLLVDAYQALGAVPFTVQTTGVDLLVCGAHKYLLGVPGLAFLYVRPGLALTPSMTGWLARTDPFDMATALDYAPGAYRFERGTPPILQAYAAHASIRWIQRLGVAAIAQHLTTLTERTIQEAQARGFSVASPLEPGRRGPFVAIRVGVKARQMAAKMAQLGVVVAPCHDVLRLAPGFYTTERDLVLSLEILADVRERDLPGLREPAWLARRHTDARPPDGMK